MNTKVMNNKIWKLGVGVMISLWWLGGCTPKPSTPAHQYQVRVKEVMADSHLKVSILELTIPTTHEIALSVQHEGDRGGGRSLMHLSPQEGEQSLTAEVFLSGAHFTPSNSEYGYIQIFLRPRKGGGFAGGPSVYPVDKETDLEDFFKVQAKDGAYAKGQAITIAEVGGGPVTLMVTDVAP